MDSNGTRRKNATRESTATLKAWLQEHIKNPYPTKGEKIMLAIITKMTLTQVSTWFANARRRLKKENKMTWTPRNRAEESLDGKSDTEYSKHQLELDDDYNDTTERSANEDPIDDQLSNPKDNEEFKNSQIDMSKTSLPRNNFHPAAHPWFDREYLNWSQNQMSHPNYNQYGTFPVSRPVAEPTQRHDSPAFNNSENPHSNPNLMPNMIKDNNHINFTDFPDKSIQNYSFLNQPTNNYYYDLLNSHGSNVHAQELPESTMPQAVQNRPMNTFFNHQVTASAPSQNCHSSDDINPMLNMPPFWNDYRNTDNDSNRHLTSSDVSESFYPSVEIASQKLNFNPDANSLQNSTRINNKLIKHENILTNTDKRSTELLDSTASPHSMCATSPNTTNINEKKS